MEAEEKRGKQLVQIGFMRRFDPSYTEIKALLSDGELGQGPDVPLLPPQCFAGL